MALILEQQQKLDDSYLPIESDKLKRLYLSKGKKVIGMIDFDEGVYYTRKVLFRNYQGLSLSAKVLAVLENYQIENVSFQNIEATYNTKVCKFYMYGEEYKDLKEGEVQLILSLEHFIKT